MTKENQELLQAIGQMIDEKLDTRFAEYDKKMDARFAEYDKKMDARFAEYDKKMDARLETLKTEILREAAAQSTVLMESYFQPQFNALSDKMDDVMRKVQESMAPMEAVLELTERVDKVEEVTIDLTRRVELLEQRQ